MGSWVLYGLGAEAKDLPGFRRAALGRAAAGRCSRSRRGNGRRDFCRASIQGVKLNSIGDPVLYIQNPPGVNAKMQRESIDAINALNRIEDATLHDPEIPTRIAQYEMAFKMQTSVPGLMDMSKEPQSGARDVRREAGRWIVRVELPAGAAPGRARRALHPALPPRLGPSRGAESRTSR